MSVYHQQGISQTQTGIILLEKLFLWCLIWSLSKSKKGFGFNLFRSFLARDSFPQLMSLVKKIEGKGSSSLTWQKYFQRTFFSLLLTTWPWKLRSLALLMWLMCSPAHREKKRFQKWVLFCYYKIILKSGNCPPLVIYKKSHCKQTADGLF